MSILEESRDELLKRIAGLHLECMERIGERDEAREALREIIGILEHNIAKRAGTVQPGGGNMHEAMLLAKWRKAAGMDTANAPAEARRSRSLQPDVGQLKGGEA